VHHLEDAVADLLVKHDEGRIAKLGEGILFTF